MKLCLQYQGTMQCNISWNIFFFPDALISAGCGNDLVTLLSLSAHSLSVENCNQHFLANVDLAPNSFQVLVLGFSFLEKNKFKFNSLLKVENTGCRPRILLPATVFPRK